MLIVGVGGSERVDIEKHIENKKRLNQALNSSLSEIQNEISDVMKKYNIDAMPELAFDVCQYIIEELYMERLNFLV